jgi:hypothetical protein
MPPIIITDEQIKEFRPILVKLALKNKDLTLDEKNLLENNIWCPNYIDNSIKCLVCLKEIILSFHSECLTDRVVFEVRYHGYLHLKEKNLLAFI